ncbi:MAG: hypothetical protein OET90_11875 [Desulfuromonadales bacterium]|nr:hypothetical protein [Desulfuromonadales bacterium]
MSEMSHQTEAANRVNFMDVLLYILAGSAMTIMSVSFILWLRF